MNDPRRWQRPAGLLLDAMGTLITLREPVGTTYAAAAMRHGLTVDPGAIDRTFPAILGAAPPLAFAGLVEEALLGAERDWWGARIEEVLRACGAPGAPAALRTELFDRFADPALWRVPADVDEHLPRWREAGLRLAVVSNFDSRLHGLLAGLGLDRWLDAVIVSSEEGAAKPSPQPLRSAIARLGLAPETVWHVGDSPEDAEAARAAGVRCLIVRRR